MDIELANAAQKMRREGHPFSDISKSLQMPIEELAKALKLDTKTLKSLQFDPGFELMRLDELHQQVWVSAIDGDCGAVDAVLKIGARRQELQRHIASVASQGGRVEGLIRLRGVLSQALRGCEVGQVAALSRQLLEVLAQIDELRPSKKEATALDAAVGSADGIGGVSEPASNVRPFRARRRGA